MSDKWSQYEVSKNQLPQGKEDNSSQIGGQIAGGSAIAGGAVAVGGAAKWMADPFVKRAILQSTQINPLMQKYNINPNIQTKDIPNEIRKQINLASNATKASSNQFKQNMVNEENAVKGGVIRSAAMNVSKNYPTWQKSGYEAYGNGLQNIEDTLAKNNQTFQPKDFNENVIQKTADTMNARGLPQEAENLTKYANARSWGVNEDGNATGTPISFSDAKQAVVNLARQNPAAARELRANWGKHIEDATQGTDVSDQMKVLNDNYKPFKEADGVAYKFAGSNPSVLDTTKVTNALHNYYLGNKQGNPETTSFLKALGNGTGGTTPIDGLSDQADAIDTAIQKRNGMMAVQKLAENDSLNRINAIKADQAQAGTLANIESGLEKQIRTRVKVGATVGGTALSLAGLNAVKGIVQSAPYGVVQNDLMTRANGGINPVDGINAAMTGAFGNDQQKQQLMNQMQQAYQKSMQT